MFSVNLGQNSKSVMKLGDNGNVKAVMLDMGGVLVDLDMDRCLNAFYDKAGFMSVRNFIDTCHPKGFFSRYEMGEFGEDVLYAECISRSRPGTTPQIIRECLESLLVGIDPAKATLLKRLSERCDLYMLSNNNPIALDYCSRMFSDAGIPLDTTFKRLFCSFRMHVSKPSPEFFGMVFDETGLLPQEAVFVDDSPVNVEAARSLGIDARWYQPGTDLGDVLKPVWN